MNSQKIRFGFVLLGILCSFHVILNAQALDSENKISKILSDGTEVVLYGQAIPLIAGEGKKPEPSTNYYYLPCNFRLAQREDGTPEFLFLKFTTDNPNDIQGAILHFLMLWGLTPQQEKELKDKLSADGGKKLMGPIDVAADDNKSFEIISATLKDPKLAPSGVISSGRAPVLPGQRVAVAVRLDKYGAQLFEKAGNKANSIKDLSLTFTYKFQVLLPAVRGNIVMDWTAIDSTIRNYIQNRPSVSMNSLQTFLNQNIANVVGVLRKPEFDSLINLLEKEKHIDYAYEELVTDERNQAIREAFQDFLLKMMDEGIEKNKNQDNSLLDTGIIITENKLRELRSRGTYTLKLNSKLAMERTFSTSANMASWYARAKNNKLCFDAVNLNDPFFSHRTISFAVDLDSKEIFESQVNYIEVVVKKRESDGTFIEKTGKLNLEYFRTKGGEITFDFQREENSSIPVYSYRTKYSLRGGGSFETKEKAVNGYSESLTLPIKRKQITLLANPDELSNAGIVVAMVQLRYLKYGKEYETSIPVITAENESIKREDIFMDRETDGVLYRVVLMHKNPAIGKMVIDASNRPVGDKRAGWSPMDSNGFAYAYIPAELSDPESEVFRKAVELGKEASMESINKEKVITGAAEIFSLFIDLFKKKKS